MMVEALLRSTQCDNLHCLLCDATVEIQAILGLEPSYLIMLSCKHLVIYNVSRSCKFLSHIMCIILESLRYFVIYLVPHPMHFSL